MKENKTKSAFISIMGKPNVGKSSLLNSLVGEKIAIVTDKAQTTRTRITGVKTQGETQFVFVDTPGLHRPKNRLGVYMVKQTRGATVGVDAVLIVAEAFGRVVSKAEEELILGLKAGTVRKTLILNKIDQVKQKTQLLERIKMFAEIAEFDAIIPISAITGEGILDLWRHLATYAKESVHFFPDDTLTDQPERVIIAEIVREKLLKNLEQEVPHAIAVVTEKIKSRGQIAKIIDIEVTIFCERENHKGIIIGKEGRMLKKVAHESRLELERFLGCKVNLQCFVKVKEDWRNKQGLLSSMGLN